MLSVAVTKDPLLCKAVGKHSAPGKERVFFTKDFYLLVVSEACNLTIWTPLLKMVGEILRIIRVLH